MQLTKKFEIYSRKSMIDFLNSVDTGRVCSIDKNGYPQIIPMNFVMVSSETGVKWNDGNDSIYMHSHPFGEKIENIKSNSRVGFEADRHLCFLPSYFFHPNDASQADTLYISVVIKGEALIVKDLHEKSEALNALMKKYQKEGGYEPLDKYMPSVKEVTVIKVIPVTMRGKYKIGQHWPAPYRLKMAEKILKKYGPDRAKTLLELMKIEISEKGILTIKGEPVI